MALDVSFAKKIEEKDFNEAVLYCHLKGFDFKLLDAIVGDSIFGCMDVDLNNKIIYFSEWFFKGSPSWSMRIIKGAFKTINE